MNNYKLIDRILSKIQYEFAVPEKGKLAIAINDSINILSIKEKQLSLAISRRMNLGGDTDFISVSYLVTLECEENCDREAVINAIRSGITALHISFSKASLIISQITEASPLGVIITAPGYDKDDIIIE